MSKGDGWAVKRYICPRCNRKGLYIKYVHIDVGCKMGCMYKNCNSNRGKKIEWDEVYKVNPQLIKEPAKYKV